MNNLKLNIFTNEENNNILNNMPCIMNKRLKKVFKNTKFNIFSSFGKCVFNTNYIVEEYDKNKVKSMKNNGYNRLYPVGDNYITLKVNEQIDPTMKVNVEFLIVEEGTFNPYGEFELEGEDWHLRFRTYTVQNNRKFANNNIDKSSYQIVKHYNYPISNKVSPHIIHSSSTWRGTYIVKISFEIEIGKLKEFRMRHSAGRSTGIIGYVPDSFLITPVDKEFYKDTKFVVTINDKKEYDIDSGEFGLMKTNNELLSTFNNIKFNEQAPNNITPVIFKPISNDLKFGSNVKASIVLSTLNNSPVDYKSLPDVGKKNLLLKTLESVIIPKPIAYYDFNGNANDDYGVYNGKWVGNEQYALGKFGQAAKFDGKNNIKLNLPTMGSEINVSFWFKANNTDNLCTMVGVPRSTNTNISNSNAIFYFYNDKLVVERFYSHGIKQTQTESKIESGIWYHISANINDNQAIIYLNGNKVNANNTYDDYWGGVNNIGSGGKRHYFNGLIDEVKVYNKPLTDDQILKLYNEKPKPIAKPTTKPVTKPKPKPVTKPIACYDFDGNANDQCGNHNGTWNGNEQYGNGINGKAAKFDGKSYIKLTDNLLNFGSKDFTVSMWINANKFDVTNGGLFYFKSTNDRNSIYSNVHSDNTGNHLVVGTYDAGGNRNDLMDTNISLETSKWYYFVFTRKSDVFSIYVNGEKFSKTMNVKIDAAGSNAKLGMNPATSGERFNGLVDELKVFNIPLTDNQIKEFYNKEKLKPKPIACYDFEGNTNDNCGNHNATWNGNEQYADGINGEAAKFDGSSYIEGHDEKIGINDGNWTLSMWVYPTKFATISNGSGAGSELFRYVTNNGSDNGFGFANDGSFYFAFWDDYRSKNHSGNYKFSTNKWYHIVITIDSKQHTKVYVNNKLSLEADIVGKSNVNSYRFIIGHSEADYFTGLIDEVKIFNQTLTDDEVLELYKAQQPLDEKQTLENKSVYNISKEIHFNGNNGVEMDIFDILKTKNFSFVLKIKTNKKGTGNGYSGNQGFLGVDSAGGGSGDFSFKIDKDGHAMMFCGLHSETDFYVRSKATNIADGKYHQVAYVLDATTGVKLYVDGVLEDEYKITLNHDLDHFNPVLGKAPYGNFEGYIKDVEVFNYPLNDNEIFLLTGQRKEVMSYTYGLSELRNRSNADNIDNLFSNFSKIYNVWIHSKYKNYTTPKVNFNGADASKFRFNRNTRWCTQSNTIKVDDKNYITFGWSDRGSTCYKGYYVGLAVEGKYNGLVHGCDCGDCDIYENKIYVNGGGKCLGNSSNSTDYDVTIFVEGVMKKSKKELEAEALKEKETKAQQMVKTLFDRAYRIFPLEDNTVDIIDLEKAIIHGEPKFVKDNNNKVIEFGDSDYIEIQKPIFPITISFWIKLENNGSVSLFWQKNNSDNGNRWNIYINNYTLYFNGGYADFHVTDKTFKANEWNHCVMSFPDSNLRHSKVWINSEQCNIDYTSDRYGLYFSDNLYFGAANNKNSYKAHGLLFLKGGINTDVEVMSLGILTDFGFKHLLYNDTPVILFTINSILNNKKITSVIYWYKQNKEFGIIVDGVFHKTEYILNEDVLYNISIISQNIKSTIYINADRVLDVPNIGKIINIEMFGSSVSKVSNYGKIEEFVATDSKELINYLSKS